MWDLATQLAGQLNLLYAKLVDVTAQVIAADAWGGQGGVRSVQHWLGLRAGLSPGTAAQVVTLASIGGGLPVLSGLIAAGKLSLDQAAAIARRVPAAYEESVCEVAPMLTVTQLRRLLGRYPFERGEQRRQSARVSGSADRTGDSDATQGRAFGDEARAEADSDSRSGEPPLGEAAPQSPQHSSSGQPPQGQASPDAEAGPGSHRSPMSDGLPGGTPGSRSEQESAPAPSGPNAGRAFVPEPNPVDSHAGRPSETSLTWEDGRLAIHGSLDGVDGALVENALREAKDALFTSGATGATWADALAEMASRSLAAIESPSRIGHYRVYVHLDTEGAWVNAREHLPWHLAERLACSATAAPLWMQDGRPVSVGRSYRAVPERLRRLVEDRDRGCAYPGCGAIRHVEIHHIRHWDDGGDTDYDNLICLCPHHHAAHHAGAFTVAASGNQLVPFVFTGRHGRRIEVDVREANPVDEADSANAQQTFLSPGVPSAFTPPLGETLDYNWITFGKRPA